jgi:hypothetical protein
VPTDFVAVEDDVPSCTFVSFVVQSFRSPSPRPAIYYEPTLRRRAVVPQHNRDLPKGTLMSLLREAGFTREQLLDFLAGR